MDSALSVSAGGIAMPHESYAALPTANDVKTFTGVIEHELQAARRDLGLLMAVARGAITSAVRLFVARAETAVVPATTRTMLWQLTRREQQVSQTPADAGGKKDARLTPP